MEHFTPGGRGRSCACTGNLSLLAVIRQDVDRCRVLAERDSRRPVGVLARTLIFYPGVYGVVAYRIAHAAQTSRMPSLLRIPLVAGAVLLQRVAMLYSGVEMSARAHAGPGLFVNHSRGVVIGAVDAGTNLTISHGVTLGQGVSGDDGSVCPVLGDRVWLGVNCVVAGAIRIGDDAAVGANAVVLHDVPDRGLAVGVPARVVARRGSFERVRYRGMGSDPGRRASLTLAELEDAAPVTDLRAPGRPA